MDYRKQMLDTIEEVLKENRVQHSNVLAEAIMTRLDAGPVDHTGDNTGKLEPVPPVQDPASPPAA